MESLKADLQRRLQGIQGRVAAACARAGRDPKDVTLVAVSKHQPLEKLTAALLLGQRDLGENYAQELRDKALALPAEALPRWHFIGPLQRNKVRLVVGRAALIHSIDRLELLEAVAARAGAAPQDILLQVNIGDEPQKAGCAPAELPGLLARAAALPGVRCRGLMCIPPALPEEDAAAARPYFQRLRALRDAHAGRHGDALRELSMGMSQDFEVAIEEGATLIRVGTALWAARALKGPSPMVVPLCGAAALC